MRISNLEILKTAFVGKEITEVKLNNSHGMILEIFCSR